ncbi:MAG TPA: helix-turn-helix domain-containing protein [Anaeromyxobacteraceae bacterium]|nr:helix-turn-helix domain-containing protein [Anaeromyxobacteraceae bacterium]
MAEHSTEDWELWTWREVARALKVSRSWVYAKAERGELPSLRVGGLLRFDPTEVWRFATSGPTGARVLVLRAPESPMESG